MSGPGGWGDLNNDFSVVDGGFSRTHLSYPSPHTVHCNFTLGPFDFPSSFNVDCKEANSTFSTLQLRLFLRLLWGTSFESSSCWSGLISPTNRTSLDFQPNVLGEWCYHQCCSHMQKMMSLFSLFQNHNLSFVVMPCVITSGQQDATLSQAASGYILPSRHS